MRLFFSNHTRPWVALVALLVVFANQAIAAPNLRTLAKSCFILHDPAGKYEVSPEWEEPAKVMQGLEILPELTKRIRDTVTADHGNKSVLIVGDASSAYRYFLASLAVSGDLSFPSSPTSKSTCRRLSRATRCSGRCRSIGRKISVNRPSVKT